MKLNLRWLSRFNFNPRMWIGRVLWYFVSPFVDELCSDYTSGVAQDQDVHDVRRDLDHLVDEVSSLESRLADVEE